MSKLRFPVEALAPKAGTIDARLFSNEPAGVPLTLFHEIEIPLQPFEAETWEGKRRQLTSVRMDFIELVIPFGGYRSLERRTFRFPRNPRPGYVDASLYLGGAHNPVDVDAIAFGPVRGRTIEVQVTAGIAFELERIGVRNVARHLFSTRLRFGALRIRSDLLPARRANLPAARKLIAPFIIAGAYGAPKLGESTIELAHR